jgi:dTDP-4-amino-4,6-dideoxygalactose transaminase
MNPTEKLLHVGAPNIGDREDFLARLGGIFDRRWLTNYGECVREFEAKIAEYLGVRHCIAMCNGTVALEHAIRATGMQGQVIVPAFTFVATAHALQWQGIRPVFCDIDPVSHCLDPVAVRRLITPEVTGIIGVHVWGRPCDTEALEAIAREHKLHLLFDAAHAFGCGHRGRMLGAFGECEVLSFHATKLLNTFEGGAIVTNDDALAAKIRLMQNFGFSGMDNVIYLGTNGKMNEVSAAMGLTNLREVNAFIAANRRNYTLYRELLGSRPGLQFIAHDESEACSYQYVVVRVHCEFGVSRDHVFRHLLDRGVRARRYFFPGCHRMEPYRTLYPATDGALPVTEALCQDVLVLPTGTAVDEADVRRVCRLIEEAARERS